MFPIFILLTAITISAVAAFFSVTGLGSLFAGAFIPVVIMASTLEIGKLVTASFLTRHWNDLPKMLRNYFVIATGILILITSAGIYGFLTSAYQITADKFSIVNQQTSVIELRKGRYQEQLNGLLQERQEVSTSITSLNSGLANNRVQYVDEQGRVITSTSTATRNALQQQLTTANQQRERISNRIEQLTDSITRLDMEILTLNSSNEVAAEIGPLRYLSNLTGIDMDKIVNYFALMIVFVFDPLAVGLVVGFNKLQVKQKRKESAVMEQDIQDNIFRYPENDTKSEWNVDSWFRFLKSKRPNS